MRTFAQKPKAPQQTTSTKWTIAGRDGTDRLGRIANNGYGLPFKKLLGAKVEVRMRCGILNLKDSQIDIRRDLKLSPRSFRNSQGSANCMSVVPVVD